MRLRRVRRWKMLESGKSIIVEVSEKDVEILERIITEITNIKHQEIMSVSGNSKLCKKCAYYDLCTI